MSAAPTGTFGTSSCTPTADAWGSVFRCRLYGLPPGATPLNYALTVPGSADYTQTITDEAVASDGSWSIDIWAGYLGLRTLTVTAGGVSKSASFTVNAPTFGLQITQHQNGSITATTKPGAYCAAYATLPDNSFVNSPALDTVKIADAVGKVSWTYPAQPGGGTGTQNVECNFGAETQFDSAQYSLP